MYNVHVYIIFTGFVSSVPWIFCSIYYCLIWKNICKSWTNVDVYLFFNYFFYCDSYWRDTLTLYMLLSELNF